MITDKIDAFCARRAPASAKRAARLGSMIRGDQVTLYERRAVPPGSDTYTERLVAQFRWDGKAKEWELWVPDRYGQWNLYSDAEASPDLEALIRVVEKDPEGDFWT